jgi:hypothetical protein
MTRTKATINMFARADQSDGTPAECQHPKKHDFFAPYHHHGSIPTSLPIAPSRRHGHQDGVSVKMTAYFPQRLFQMLETIEHTKCQLSNIVSWHPTGKGFVIHDPDAFVSQIMPVFFRSQSKLSSFRRQLNNYGFQHTHDESNVRSLTYYHQLFLRDYPKRCREIVLKNRKKKKKAHLRIPPPSTPALYRKEEARLSLLFEKAPPKLHSSWTVTSHESTNMETQIESFSQLGFTGDALLDAAAAEVCYYPTEGVAEQEEEAPMILTEDGSINSVALEDGLGSWDPAIESLGSICFDMFF